MELAVVKNDGLPSVLRCHRCKKNKSLNNFANKRLQDLKHHGGVGSGYELLCLLCTTGVSGPKTELKCTRCDEIKPITAFAKTQRARDEPECQKCTVDRLAAGDSDAGSSCSSRSDGESESGSDSGSWDDDIPATRATISANTPSTMLDTDGGVPLGQASSSWSTTASSRWTQNGKQPEAKVNGRETLRDVAAQVSDSEDSD